MTAQQIHDALTLLPLDLVAEADSRRSFSPKVIPWKRYLSLAACLVLLVSSGWFCLMLFHAGGTKQNAAAEVPMLQADRESANDVETPAEAAPMAPEEAAGASQEQAENTMKVIDFPKVTLTVSHDQDTLSVPVRSYHLFNQGDGDIRADTNSAIPKLETQDNTLELHWSQEPDALSVWLSEEETGMPSLTYTTTAITLRPGTHTYYLSAHWTDYVICYAIHITLQEA